MRGQPLHQPDAIHAARHHHVRQDQVDRAQVGRNRRIGAVYHGDLRLQRAQQAGDGVGDGRIVFDAQDARPAQGVRGQRRCRRAFSGHCFRAARQQHTDGRSHPFAPDECQPTALAGEAVHLRQSQSRPLSNQLGGKKWLKGMARRIFGHALAVIGQGQAYEFAGQARPFFQGVIR